MLITVDEFLRGDAYSELVTGKYSQTSKDGREYIAIKVSATFLSIDSIDVAKAETDDPEVMVDAIFNFDTYTSDGAGYDNVNYSVSGQSELTKVYEGATTSGYFCFEIEMDDPAPYLVYKPVPFGDGSVWITLK